MDAVVVYEVDSDRGTYWEFDDPEDGFIVFAGDDVQMGAVIMDLARRGYEVKVYSQDAYRKWLTANHVASD